MTTLAKTGLAKTALAKTALPLAAAVSWLVALRVPS
jgi:hypothetical protein